MTMRLTSDTCGALVTRVAASLGFLLFITASVTAAEEQGKRIALIIGNDAYSSRPLQNAVNDARAMDKSLQGAGFRTILRENASKVAMEQATVDLLEAIGPADTVLFFYAGHAVQIENENFLIPVDFQAANSVIDAKFRSLSLARIFEEIKRSRAKRTIFIVDACRSNPVSESQSLQGGLANPLNAGKETYIAYSTSPNHVAADNPNGRNSWFTEALAGFISQTKLNGDIDDVFTRVRSRVEIETQGKQTPWSISSLTSKFYFHQPSTQELDDDPSLAEKLMDDVRVREQRGEWSEAIELLNRVIERHPGGTLEADANRKLPYLTTRRDAQQRFEAGEYSAAAQLFDKAYMLDPFSIPAALDGAISYLLDEKVGEGVRLLKAVRVRGSSASVAKAEAMMKELAVIYPEAGAELKSGLAQPPPIEEIFSGMRFGVPDWDAANRQQQRKSTVELTRWIRELTPKAPVMLAATPSQGDESVPPVNLTSFHVEVISSSNTRDIALRRVTAAGDGKFNTSGAQRPSGVSVRVVTDPPGADLTIEGDAGQRCQSPCVLNLLPSRQIVQAHLDGFREAKRVLDVTVSLTDVKIALEQEFGFLQFDGESGDTAVLLDGKTVAQQVPAKLQLPVGKYEVRTVQDRKILSRMDIEVKPLSSVAIPVKR